MIKNLIILPYRRNFQRKSIQLIILSMGILTILHSISSSLPMATAQEFSGALQWAHKKGIYGKGQKALVLEFALLPQADLQYYEIQYPKNVSYSQEPTQQDIDHCRAVIDVLTLVAPRSTVLLMDSRIGRQLSITYANKPFLASLEDTSVVNCSGIPLDVSDGQAGGRVPFTQEKASEILDPLDQLLNHSGKQKLLVWASGNRRKSLSDDADAPDWEHSVPSVVLSKNPALLNNIIFIGSVNHDNNPMDNYPGRNIHFQENFLCTLGDKIKLSMEISFKGKFEGTSGAAPVVAGVALLLQEKYPDLSTFDIKEVLLESASREFVRYSEDDGEGWPEYIFVYDPSDGNHLGPFPPKEKARYSVKAEPFNPEIYGKGILDVRAAFLYAALKRKSLIQSKKTGSPLLTRKQLRTQMKRILKTRNTEAAKKIQSFVRRHLQKK